MVTMHSWLFLRSFAELRASSKEKLSLQNSNPFQGILRETKLEALTHLGRYAFSEIDVPGSPILFILKNALPTVQHKLWACRLIARRPAEEQAFLLRRVSQAGIIKGLVYKPVQINFLTLPETPIVYWLQDYFFALLRSGYRLRDIAEVCSGLSTTDNERFLRFFWEVSKFGIIHKNMPISGRWFWYVKAGRYQKWFGLERFVVNWDQNGAAIKAFVVTLPGTTHWSRRVVSDNYYFHNGLTYTLMARGNLSTRVLNDAIFDGTSVSIFTTSNISCNNLAALTASHVASYLLRVTTQDLKFSAGYVANLPLTNNAFSNLLDMIGSICIKSRNY